MKPACNTALKEWSSVVEALRAGRQTLLIRKGGLADKGKVFALQADEFLLYPSFLHQQVEFVKRDFVDNFDRATRQPAPKGTVVFDTCAVAEEAFPVWSADELKRLDGLHIWNDRFIDHRLQWKPDHPAWVVLLRVYLLPSPVTLTEERRYVGCRSWVNLDKDVYTKGATPILGSSAFDDQAAAIRHALSAPANA